MNSPVRLGVKPTPSTPTDFYSQRSWGFISPCWSPGLCSLSHSPVVPPGLSTHKCGTTQSPTMPTLSPSHHLAMHPFCLGFPSPPLLPVWMNVYLTPWLSDFHEVLFSISSGCFLFLNLLSSFWLCEEAQCIYLCLHLGWKSKSHFYQTMYLNF